MAGPVKSIDPRRRTKGTARIRVLVEVQAGTWGGDCPLDQVYRQASREALEKVSRLLGSEGRVLEASVTAVMTEEVR
jgi:hypothetical protein